MTYSFDPAAATGGTHTITYTYTDGNNCTNSASDEVEVFALPVVTFTALADLYFWPTKIQAAEVEMSSHSHKFIFFPSIRSLTRNPLVHN